MSEWVIRHQRLVNVSAIVAGVVVVARTVGLFWSEPWFWMAEAGELAYDIGLAWLTAWAFQLLVIVIPAERERRHLEQPVARRVNRLIDVGMRLEEAITRQLGKTPKPKFTFDSADLQAVCESTPLTGEVPGWFGDWGTLLDSIAAAAERNRGALRPFYPRLSPDLITALEEEDLAMEALARTIEFLRIQMHHPPAGGAPSSMKRLTDPLSKWLTSIDMLVTVRASSLARELPLPERTAASSAGSFRIPMEQYPRWQEHLGHDYEQESPSRPTPD